MNNGNSTGGFWVGIIIGIAAMYLWYHPKFQDKTAQEWSNLNDQTNVQLNITLDSYNNLARCLKNIYGTYDYISTYSEIIRKNDLDSCVNRYPVPNY